MSPIVIRYQLDPSGIDLNNRVENEPHIMIQRQIRSVATSYGAFFAESLLIVDSATQLVLVQDVDYYAAELYEVPTARFGKKICAIVVITNVNVSSNITITYQAVGGDFSTSATAIVQMLDNLNLDNRPVAWGSIIAKPSEYPPSHHLHDVGDVYGFEYVVHAIDRVGAAILLGDSSSHDAIYKYVDILRDYVNATASSTGNSFNAHTSDYNNPHKVTAAQLGVYLKAETSALVSAMGNAATDSLALKANITSPTFTGVANASGGLMTPWMEIGSTTVATTPFIDFHSSGTVTDYDARIIAQGPTASCTLTYAALGGHIFSQSILVNGLVRAITSTQATYDSAGLITQSVTGNAAIGFHAQGATAAMLIHLRGDVGVGVYDGSGTSFSTFKAKTESYSTGSNDAVATIGLLKSLSYASLANPALTGIPTAPTASTPTNNTQIATTAFVKNLAYAPIASPAFTGKVVFADGTAASPSFTFLTETAQDTGLYWIGDGVMGIACNGIKAGQFATGGLTLTGDLSANSDIRLKENIEVITNALDKVDAIKGITFNKIADTDKVRKTGVIAQDIFKVIPEAVTIDEEGIMSVAYGNLVGLLIEAVKELRLEVNSLKESKAKE